MRKMIRKSTFWVAVIVASFALNVLVAVVTLHRHIRYQDEQQSLLASSSSLSLFAVPSALGGSRSSDGNVYDVANNRQTPESVLWRRMLQQEVSTGYCGQRAELHPGRNKTENNTAVASEALLPPFGFRHHVEQFVQMSSEPQHGSLRGGLSAPDATSFTVLPKYPTTTTTTTCYLPPTTACYESHYSVVMYSKAKNLRRLLLNLMTFQSYPSVNDITLIVPSAETLRSDRAYGTRILDWDDRGTIHLLVVEASSTTSLWASLGQQLKPKTSAILWVDGDVQKDWNGTSFRTNFDIWRQNTRSLVASFSGHDENNRPETGSSTATALSQQQQCPHNRLHGTLMHQNWLCFLNHPVMDPLKQYLEPHDGTAAATTNEWGVIFNGLSILWNQIGQGQIMVMASSPLPNHRPITVVQPPKRPIQTTPIVTTTTTTHLSPSSIKLATILDYFGCACEVNFIDTPKPLESNSTTCVQEQE